MSDFSTQLPIGAKSQRVWDLLTHLADWPRWNSTVERVEGTAAPQERVKVWVKINPGRAFPVRVIEFSPCQRMVWSGGMPFGLFRGIRVFELRQQPPGTLFSMAETYTGPMAGVIKKSIPNLQPAFDEFAQCLKREAESS